MNVPAAQDFTTLLAKQLATELISGVPMTEQVVAQHCKKIASACGLAPTGADALHISDIYKKISHESSAIKGMDHATAARYIFKLIDMH